MAGSRYAVLFRVHFWDEFAERQYQRLLSVVGSGDVFILVNESGKRPRVPHEHAIFHTEQDVLAPGLNSESGGRGVLWYNGDYALYFFYNAHKDYDYYVMTEYDVVVKEGLDGIISHMARRQIDFIGLTQGDALRDSWILDSCLDVYAKEQIRKQIICIAMFSNRAVRHLFESRLALSQQQRAGRFERWPYCEAYIPTELASAGMTMAELSEFGTTHNYRSFGPAILEDTVCELAREGFLHPVLDTSRFVQYTFAWSHVSLKSLFGALRRMRRVPLRWYARPAAEAVRRYCYARLQRFSQRCRT